MDETNGGWDDACERMAHGTATGVAGNGNATAAALVHELQAAYEKCAGIFSETGQSVWQPAFEADADAAWHSAARRMLERIAELRGTAERLVGDGTTPRPGGWDEACQRMAAEARAEADANWRSLSLELAEVAAAAAAAALVAVRTDPEAMPQGCDSLLDETNWRCDAHVLARRWALQTLEMVERVREADA